MELFAYIVDATTKSPVPFASILVTDSLGLPRFVATVAGADGYFYLNDSRIQSTDKLLISSVGYKQYSIPVTQIEAYNAVDEDMDIGIVKNVQSLPPVVITAPAGTTNKTDISKVIEGLGLLVALIMLSKQMNNK